MKINLAQSDFKIVNEGEVVLKIASAKAVPAAKPNQIEIKFEDSQGASINSSYQFNNEKSMFVFTLIVQKALGVTDKTFDTDNTGNLVGKYLKVLVKHTTKESTKKPGDVVTFANINRIIEAVEGFDDVVENQSSYGSELE